MATLAGQLAQRRGSSGIDAPHVPLFMGAGGLLLRPNGRLLIADFPGTNEYAGRLRQRGLAAVEVRALGWRSWHGGPWTATRPVTARKPA